MPTEVEDAEILSKFQDEIPASFLHLRQDLGRMNQHFWDIDERKQNPQYYNRLNLSYNNLSKKYK